MIGKYSINIPALSRYEPFSAFFSRPQTRISSIKCASKFFSLSRLFNLIWCVANNFLSHFRGHFPTHKLGKIQKNERKKKFHSQINIFIVQVNYFLKYQNSLIIYEASKRYKSASKCFIFLNNNKENSINAFLNWIILFLWWSQRKIDCWPMI